MPMGSAAELPKVTKVHDKEYNYEVTAWTSGVRLWIRTAQLNLFQKVVLYTKQSLVCQSEHSVYDNNSLKSYDLCWMLQNKENALGIYIS